MDINDLNKEIAPKAFLDPAFTENRDRRENILLLIDSEIIGDSDREFGKKLMYSFLYSLTETSPKIDAIVLLNGGVNLVFNGSKTIEPLSVLNEAKVGIIVCEESLNYYGNRSILKLGRPVSMYTISNMLLSAEKVITI